MNITQAAAIKTLSDLSEAFATAGRTMAQNGNLREAVQPVVAKLFGSSDAQNVVASITAAVDLLGKIESLHRDIYYKAEPWKKNVFLLLSQGRSTAEIVQILGEQIPQKGSSSAVNEVDQVRQTVMIACGCNNSAEATAALQQMYASYRIDQKLIEQPVRQEPPSARTAVDCKAG